MSSLSTTMKLRILLLACGVSLFAVLPLLGAKAAPPKPLLTVDSTPVNDGKSPLIASYAEVVAPVQKAVVSVYSAKIVRQRVSAFPFTNPYFRQMFPDQERETREEGLGSGVVVSPDGYILTNNHVVEGADELKVALADDREFKAKVIGNDPKTDVAVIKIEAENLPVVTLADSDQLRVGDVVFAIGNPLDIGQTVTMGIVSATGRKNLGLLDNVAGYENFIQTDAAINLGNSGGALVDAKGRLVGINSAIISTTRGSMGIGLAVPVNLARSIMQSLVDTGTVARGYLGVGVDSLTAELAEAMAKKGSKGGAGNIFPPGTNGVVINNLTPDGPALKAGLKVGDVIVAIGDKPVTSWEDLRLVVAQTAPGTKVKVKYLRDGKPAELEIALSRLEDNSGAPNEFVQGVSVAKLTDELRRTYRVPDEVDGPVVTEIADDSPVRAQFRPGMVIVQVNGEAIDDAAGGRAQLHPGRNFCLVWVRGGFRYIPFEMR
jgi:Do/DeqQ family serine protease